MPHPPLYSHELALTICQRIAEGQSLSMICSEKEMPNKTTIFRWIQKHADFRSMYALAKEMMVASFAEEMLAIADDASRDTITLRNGRKIQNRKQIKQAKITILTLQWLIERLMPTKYGAWNKKVGRRRRRQKPARRRRSG